MTCMLYQRGRAVCLISGGHFCMTCVLQQRGLFRFAAVVSCLGDVWTCVWVVFRFCIFVFFRCLFPTAFYLSIPFVFFFAHYFHCTTIGTSGGDGRDRSL
jgi:hypothetical protein